jgi:hypothetical protein
MSLTKLNTLMSDNINDLKKFSIVTTRKDLFIENDINVHYFSPLDYTHRDTWKYEDFSYDITNLGFRDNSTIPSDIDIAAFGCSFTFGQGLPKNVLWHNLLGDWLQLSTYNFGQPAASVKTTLDIFSVMCNHTKIKHAIFLLPPFFRLQIASKHKYSDNIELIPIIPNYASNLENSYMLDASAIYKSLPDEELCKNFKDNVYLMEYIAKKNNIKIYYSSWDNSTYEILLQMKFKNAIVLPRWIDYTNPPDLARDMLHPGPSNHNKWAEEIKPYIT